MELLINSSRRIAAGLSLLGALLTSTAEAVQLKVEPAAGYERVIANLTTIPRERFARAHALTGAPDVDVAVQIISESEARERQVQTWVSGYAVSSAMTIVLIPARAVTYPNDGIEDVVVHEVTHILIDVAAGGRDVPRWFHEGVAMYAATGWDLEDATRLTFTMWSESPTSVAAIDRAFYSGSVGGAYALSGALVRHLIQENGETFIAVVLSQIRGGASFEQAFSAATGRSFGDAVADFWTAQRRWTRLVPVLSSTLALWLGVTALSLFAYRRRRRRDAETLARWTEEEPDEEEPSDYNPVN